MSDLATIRKRIERATGYFARREGIVLTTFNLHGQFLEEQALPSILGVEAASTAARNAGVHGQLAETDCTVFYDPTVHPGVSGKFRYVARPVPLRGRLFHPKIVVIAGQSEDGTTWVYLAVSSANLSLSGWGRNAESFGETWIHTKAQQAWRGLDGFLAWLQNYASLDEDHDDRDAVTVVRAALARMPSGYRFRDDDTKPWSGTLYARFYSSVVDREGLPSFLKMGRSRQPTELWVYSPYWGSVPEMVAEFGAKRTALVPAMRADRKALGLSKGQHEALADIAEVWRNENEKEDDRFWHMKAYWIRHGKRYDTAVGSCNFSEPGLAGANGNVEAMLVFEGIDPDWPVESPALPDELSEQPVDEEEAPDPVPVVIVVAYDWRAKGWRWFLDADDSQDDFRLSLPTGPVIRIAPGTPGKRRGDPPDFPARFKVSYKERTERKQWEGQVVELHLDDTGRTYGKPLSASDILDSWRFRMRTGGTGRLNGPPDDDEDEEVVEADVPAAFDAVNLYDLYRAMRTLRSRLAELEPDPQALRALLVRRPDSVMALAKLAAGDGEAPVVRYLVLRELSSVVAGCIGSSVAESAVRGVQEMKRQAKTATLGRLASDLGGDRRKARKMLNWFEKRLAGMDGPVT